LNQKQAWLEKPEARPWGSPGSKSYLIPALEIPAFVLALNGASRLLYSDQAQDGKKEFATDFSTFWDHLVRGPWQTDRDPFRVNQVLHPYQGSFYHGFARSAGLNYWESMGYTFAGSFLWETAGETTPPSINDQVASGIAGSFLGESLFRIASLLLEGNGKPGFWRELSAAVISPPTGFNRLVFGERFRPVFPSRNPAIFWRLRLGATVNTHISDKGASGIQRNETAADFSMSYGLPGKPGYSYRRPFDYFQFELATVNSLNDPVGNLTTRGLLLGTDYRAGESYRGIWGLYGSYDYLSPRLFRVSSTGLSVGTTAQWWLSRLVALQGSAMSGIGYGAGSNISGRPEQDYHYGAIGQGLLAFRLIFGNIGMLDVTGRGYYVSGVLSDQPRARDTITHVRVGATLRIGGRHALGVQYLTASRQGHYPGVPDRHQTVGTFTLVYTLLSDTSFGAVEWRDQ
jgi:hypothetical protein